MSDVEIRLNEDGTLDEVVGGTSVHLEQMTDTHWWLAVNYPGGRVTVNLTSKRVIKASIARERDK